MSPTRDRQVRHASRRLALQATALILGCLVLVAGVQWVLIERSAHTSASARLDDATASLDRPEEAPRDVLVTIIDTQGERSSEQLPPGLPLRADLTAVGRDGKTRERSLSTGGYEFLVRTERVDGRVVQAALDRQPLEDESQRLIKGLLWAGLFGVLAAAAAATWLARRAVAPLARTIDLQRRFVADASHELRTPLTLLSTRAQMLARKARRGDDVHDEIAGVVADARNLGDVLDELLVAADPRTGPARKPCDLSAMAVEVVAAATAAATDRGLRLTVEAPTPWIAPASSAAVRRAMTALVDNALDHAAQSVEVRVGGTRRGVVVEVLDDGPGIRPEVLPHVFDRFASRRDGTEHTTGRRHYGLGLALVADVAASHGGQVSAGNRSGVAGSRFVLELPRQR